MPKFYYRAKKGPQEIVESTVEAVTKEEAFAKIDKLGYIPVRIFSEGEKKKTIEAKQEKSLSFNFFSRIRSRDITIFVEQLSSLVRSKIPVFEAVNILASQAPNPELKKIISSIAAELKDGKTFADSLSRYPRIFSKLFIGMVRSGESGGVLEETLGRLARFRQEEEELKAKVISALVYPLFIAGVGALTIFLLLTFGVPRLMLLFGEIGQALPLPTRILITTSDWIRGYWYWGLLALLSLFLVLKKSSFIERNQLAMDSLKLRIPLFGGFFKEALSARFLRTFAILLANGIPVFQALNITILSLENKVFKQGLESIKESVASGVSFAQGMERCGWFPPFIINMISVSEKRGDLEGGLAEAALFYEREVNKKRKIMTSLFEPAIVLVMGLIVAFIVFAMILPVFEISVGM